MYPKTPKPHGYGIESISKDVRIEKLLSDAFLRFRFVPTCPVSWGTKGYSSGLYKGDMMTEKKMKVTHCTTKFMVTRSRIRGTKAEDVRV